LAYEARVCADRDRTQVAEQLRTVGVVVVRDPRVSADDSAAFLDMMEDYFAQPDAAKLADARPAIGYQLGVTPGRPALGRARARAYRRCA
jgi:hypothetical protein